MRKIILCFFAFILFSSCSDDKQEGTLMVSFARMPAEIEIYAPGVKVPIYQSSLVPAEISIPLNTGNYTLVPRASDNSLYEETGFQIRQDETTRIVYNDNNKVVTK